MTNRTRAGVVFAMVSLGLMACGEHDAPTAPQLPPVERPQPTAVQPRITAIAPQVGSTAGGAWAMITGVDFQVGATVRLGDRVVRSWTYDSSRIGISDTLAHAAGAIDVIVTNPGGLQDRLAAGYTYQSPASFDPNGDWLVYVGEFETDVRFAIRNGVLLSVSCDRSAPLTFVPPPSIRNGEFSFVSDDGRAISGTLVSPVDASGTINVPGCPAGPWWAHKIDEGSAP